MILRSAGPRTGACNQKSARKAALPLLRVLQALKDQPWNSQLKGTEFSADLIEEQIRRMRQYYASQR